MQRPGIRLYGLRPGKSRGKRYYKSGLRRKSQRPFGIPALKVVDPLRMPEVRRACPRVVQDRHPPGRIGRSSRRAPCPTGLSPALRRPGAKHGRRRRHTPGKLPAPGSWVRTAEARSEHSSRRAPRGRWDNRSRWNTCPPATRALFIGSAEAPRHRRRPPLHPPNPPKPGETVRGKTIS